MSTWKHRLQPVCLILAGLLLGLSAPGFGLWPLAWLGLIPALGILAKPRKPIQMGLLGAYFGAGFAALYYAWFFNLHPLTWLGFGETESRLVTLAGWLILVLETAGIVGLLFLAYDRMTARWQRILLFPLLWILGFASLNLTPLALPWAQLEYTQAAVWPVRWLTSLISGSGIAYLIVLHNSFWAEQFHTSQAPANTAQPLLKKLIPMAFCPMILAILNMFPEPQWNHQAWPNPVAVIQGNIPIEAIRSGALDRETIQKSYIQPLAHVKWPPGTLLVYPEEGVAPGWTPIQAPYLNPRMFELLELAQQRQFYIAVGVSSKDAQNHRYNSLALITPDEWILPEDRVQFYHKRRLVPFGEYTPYGLGDLLTSLLNKLNIEYVTPYDTGIQSPLLKAGNSKLGGLICFELIDSGLLQGGFAQKYAQQGANLLINSSNLGWFHQDPLLEAQFLAIGQIRAAETRLPLVISSNTGISAIISAQGHILQQTHPNRQNQTKPQVIFYNGK